MFIYSQNVYFEAKVIEIDGLSQLLDVQKYNSVLLLLIQFIYGL